MSVPGHPIGYDETKDVAVSHQDCHITIGFDRQRNHIPCFLVRLHYMTSPFPVQWEAIARFDHNETGTSGHDVYQEGLHIDVSIASGGEVKLHPPHSQLPQNRGKVIRRCVEYFDAHADFFVDVYTGSISPGSPPGWPDGGDREIPPTLITPHTVPGDMPPEPRGDETLSPEELSEALAEATGTSAAEIEAGAEEIEIAPPEDAEVIERSE